MVAATDLKAFKTTNNLGGVITSTVIASATPNNLFTNVPNNERVLGEDYYACVYWKNVHANEAMDNFKIWLTDKSFPRDTEIKWAIDPVVTNTKVPQPYIFFDGSNDFVDSGNEATLWSLSLTKFSFSFWIHPIAAWDGNDRFVVRHGTAAAQSFHCYIDDATTGQILFQIRNAANTAIQANSTSLTLNAWNHVVCTYDNTLGSANLKIYVNGVLGGTTADLTEAINLSAALTLSDSTTDFKGYMKDFRWWTTKPLTQTEITAMYNGGFSYTTTALTPNYWLKMTEGTGNPVDTISGSKVGTLTNGALWSSAQLIADKYTAPIVGSWNTLGGEPSSINFTKLLASGSFPMWVWYHVNANAVSRLDDSELFTYKFQIPQGGSGSSGGGSGGDETGYHFQPYHTYPSSTAFNNDTLTVVSHSASLSLNNFTLSAWFRTTKDYTSEGAGYMITKGNFVGGSPGNNINYALLISTDITGYNALETVFDIASANGGGHFATFSPSSVDPNDGQWHHGVSTYDGSDLKLYFDGARVTSSDDNDAGGQTPDTGTHDLIIGGHENFPTYKGDLDEVRIWDVALTATEISVLFTTGEVPRTSDIVYENTFGGSGSSGGSSGGTGGNPPPANTDFKIAVCGDWGCEPETDDVIDLIQSQDYDFTVGVGDNAYESASCWTTRFQPLKPNFNSAYGNHEYEESGGVTPYKTFFGHSLTYFTFKFQNFQFFVFDTNINFDSGSAQHTAMTAAINSSLNDNTVTWRACVLHHPMFGSPSQHSYNDGNFNQTWQEFFQTHKINFVFVGHNHNWQRTHQVAYNAGDPEDPTVVDNSSPYSASAVGLIHVISGTGGHDSPGSLYDLGSQPSFQAFQDNDHNGVWEMVASNNGHTLTCSFRDIDGDVYDTFTISA